MSVILLGFAIVGLVSLAPHQRLSGDDGVANARLITLRAPMDGEVEIGPRKLNFATPISRGDVLLRITNQHADRARVDDLARQIEQLKEERTRLETKLASAKTVLNDLTEQTRHFVEARVLQLEARRDELNAELAAARAKSVEARASLDRFTMLASKGWIARAQLDLAARDGSIAERLEAAAQKRLEAGSVELAAAQRGIFIAGNNDRPHSMRRADQVLEGVNALTEALAAIDRRLDQLNGDLVKERTRYIDLTTAEVVAPIEGSVWEVLATPGEQVHRGQELARMLGPGPDGKAGPPAPGRTHQLSPAGISQSSSNVLVVHL